MRKNIYKEETRSAAKAPACCLTCGHYLPAFFTVADKECAAFGTTTGVKLERCGAWTKRTTPDNI